MARPKRPPRARTVERRTRQADDKLARSKAKLLDLMPGGAPSNPLDVPSAALVEPKARSVLCPRCDEPFTLEAHEAHATDGARLREARLRCRLCGERRSMWFRVIAAS
jgi:hypothetical protein